MVKRLFDIMLSAAALVLLSPILLIVATGIRLSSRGPIFYRARRVGLNGEEFTMHKFRTMETNQWPAGSPITAPNDSRVFLFGSVLRHLKIDELPQLYDVLRGKMSFVGPRPEDPRCVRERYTAEDMQIFAVLPGITSPASIYDYTHGDQILSQGEAEEVYFDRLLPMKLALEAHYVHNATFLYDILIIVRTIAVIILVGFGKRSFSEPAEMRHIWTCCSDRHVVATCPPPRRG